MLKILKVQRHELLNILYVFDRSYDINLFNMNERWESGIVILAIPLFVWFGVCVFFCTFFVFSCFICLDVIWIARELNCWIIFGGISSFEFCSTFCFHKVHVAKLFIFFIFFIFHIRIKYINTCSCKYQMSFFVGFLNYWQTS